MKKTKLLTILSTFVLCLGMMLTPTNASEYVEISEYKETFKPTDNQNAELTIKVKGTADEDGYLYLIKTLDNMSVISVDGDCVVGEIEEVTSSKITFYRIKVNTKEETEVSVKCNVEEFYPAEATAEDNGGSNYVIDYTFTNHFQSEIGKYNVTVYVPLDNETVKVSTPAKYDKQKLGITDDGYRSVGAGGKLAPAASTQLTFTYNTPLSGIMNIVVWVLCLGIGGFVFVDRLKKAKQ